MSRSKSTMLHVDFEDYENGPNNDYLDYDDITKVLYPKKFSDDDLQALGVGWFEDFINPEDQDEAFENYIRGKLIMKACDAHDLVKLIRNKCVGNRNDFSYKYADFPNLGETDTSLTEHMIPNESNMEVCLLSAPSRAVLWAIHDLVTYITQGGKDIEMIKLLCGSFTLENDTYTEAVSLTYTEAVSVISEIILPTVDILDDLDEYQEIIQQLGWCYDDLDDKVTDEQAYGAWIKLRGKYLWSRLRFWVRTFGRPGLIAGICHFWEELIFRPDAQGRAPKRLRDEVSEILRSI